MHGNAFLKKEHRIPWRDRLANAWDGFGFVSQSTREAKILQRAERAKVPCPEVLAHGAKGKQAFLFLGGLTGMKEMRAVIQENPKLRPILARALGMEIARMHGAGFEHRELFTKHVLVGPGLRFGFIDWQRARIHKNLSWPKRCRDLATLDATLMESLATDRVRLTFLHSYWRNLEVGSGPIALMTFAGHVRRLSLKLQQKHRVRALRRLPLPTGSQNLIWLDGEALCITQAFREEIGASIPDWLRCRTPESGAVETLQVKLGEGRTGNLVRPRSVRGLGRWLLSWLRTPSAPEVQQAALLFRLQRHHVPSPKLLAFGQDRHRYWCQQSFLLTEIPRSEGTLDGFLSHTWSVRRRGKILRQAGALLRGLHEAGYALGVQAVTFASMCGLQKLDRLFFTRIDGLERDTRVWSKLALRDIPILQSRYELPGTEMLRFLLGYLGTTRLNSEGRALARNLLGLRASEVGR